MARANLPERVGGSQPKRLRQLGASRELSLISELPLRALALMEATASLDAGTVTAPQLEEP